MTQQAKERQLAGKKADLQANLPEGKTGQARDAAGKAFGVASVALFAEDKASSRGQVR